MKEIKKGSFIKVNQDIGVVVKLPLESNTPEAHFGVWFGEVKNEKPLYRTVPIEYCILVSEMESYH